MPFLPLTIEHVVLAFESEDVPNQALVCNSREEALSRRRHQQHLVAQLGRTGVAAFGNRTDVPGLRSLRLGKEYP